MGAALVEGNALCLGRGHWLMWEVPKMAEGNRGAYPGFLVFFKREGIGRPQQGKKGRVY